MHAVVRVLTSLWFIGPVVFALCLVILWLFKGILVHHIRRFAGKTKTKIDDVLIAAINIPLNLIIIGVCLLILEKILPFPAAANTDKGVLAIFHIIVIVSLALFFDKLFKGFINEYSEKVDVLKGSKEIVFGILRGIIIVLSLLIILDSLGVSITPLLASLGIGSLAVALALQDTLANFFAGLQILLDKPVVQGQFIRLDSGQEGFIEKIGWRSTWIRMLPNNIVVIPNTKLINNTLVNYDQPAQDLAVTVDFGVHYDSDLNKTEHVACEVAEHIMKQVEGGMPEFKPLLRYHTFGDSSINCSVVMRARKFTDSFIIKHEFIKALQERFKKEKIVMPYPMRTVELSGEISQKDKK